MKRAAHDAVGLLITVGAGWTLAQGGAATWCAAAFVAVGLVAVVVDGLFQPGGSL